jgi:hypothetical protein
MAEQKNLSLGAIFSRIPFRPNMIATLLLP